MSATIYDLCDTDIRGPGPRDMRPRKTPQERFDEFVARCPDVYRAFVQYALRLKRAGKTRYSADAILHVIRFETDLADNAGDFKINNNFSAPLARKAMAEYPELKDFFETRRSKGDA